MLRLRSSTGGIGPAVTISVGIATFPADGRVKDVLVKAADVDLYRVKPTHPDAGRRGDVTADAYLTALNETAVALMDRIDPTELLGTIVRRAADLVGSPHGYVYVVDQDHDRLVMQAACGMFVEDLGYHLDRGVGVGGTVWETGALVVVPDYDAMPSRATRIGRPGWAP